MPGSRAAALLFVVVSCLAARPAAGDFPSLLLLDELDGDDGFALVGVDELGRVGLGVALGDVNGDGVADLIAGGGGGAGRVFVLFGSTDGFPAVVDPADLDGSNGFRFDGAADGDSTGDAVASVGDVDGDGVGDLAIGAYRADPEGRSSAGETYVVFGSTAPFPRVFGPGELDGSNGFVVRGAAADEQAGFAVAGAGDVDVDGFDDLLVGAPRADGSGGPNAGAGYVLYGADSFPPAIDLAVLDPGTGSVLEGGAFEDEAGWAVSAARDVDGDGIGDVLIGAPLADPGGQSVAGEGYVVYGSAGGFGALLDLGELVAAEGATLEGSGVSDLVGSAISGAGDLDGDGLADLVIGAPAVDVTGKAYAIFGVAAGLPGTVVLEEVDGSDGFAFLGSEQGSQTGAAVATAGDLDSDGFADLVVGAFSKFVDGADGTGEAYVVFGQPRPFPALLGPADLDGANGFTLRGAAGLDKAGVAVAGGGDLDGDGVEDLVVGASGADAGGVLDAGTVYVVFGRPQVELSATGACPGEVTVAVSGATGDERLLLVRGAERGATQLPGGPCAGATLDLADPGSGGVVTSDPDGAFQGTLDLPAGACGALLQAVDLATCRVSGLAALP